MPDNLFTLNLAQKDVQDVLANVKTKAKELTNGQWSDFLDSDLGYALLKSAVSLYDFNAFYTDQQVAETFLALAKQRESVIRMAKQLNYPVDRIQAATVQVELTFPAFNEQIDIPADSLWKIDGKTFMNEEPITIPPDNTSLQMSLIQGTRYSSTFVANGQSWYKVKVPLNVADLAVSVEDEGFMLIDSWIDNSISNACKIYEDTDGKLTLLFGANLGTVRPADGDEIFVEGVLTSGAAGNIEASGLPCEPITVIRDNDDNEITNSFSGVTISSAIGGDDPESTESIRANAPAFYATQGRLVTARDYEVFVATLPGVIEVKAIGGETIGQYGSVLIIVYGEDPYTVNEDFLDMIFTSVKGINVLTINPIVKAPEIIEETLTVKAGIQAGVFNDSADGVLKLNNAILSFYSALRIGKSRYEAPFETAAMGIPGVEWITFTSTLKTFALSTAGDIKIPLNKNYNLKTCKIRKADNSILFEGDATDKVKDGYLVMQSPGLADQKLTLEFTADDAVEDGGNVRTKEHQLVLLKGLSITTEFTDL